MLFELIRTYIHKITISRKAKARSSEEAAAAIYFSLLLILLSSSFVRRPFCDTPSHLLPRWADSIDPFYDDDDDDNDGNTGSSTRFLRLSLQLHASTRCCCYRSCRGEERKKSQAIIMTTPPLAVPPMNRRKQIPTATTCQTSTSPP